MLLSTSGTGSALSNTERDNACSLGLVLWAAEEAGPRQFTVRVVLTVGRAVNRRSRTRRGNECPLHLQVCKAQISDPPER